MSKGDDNIDLKPGDEGFEQWGVDNSQFVPLLIRELQLLREREKAKDSKIAALEIRIKKLENPTIGIRL